MIQEFEKIDKVQGDLKLPGDKSISHRAVMFSAMAKGESKIFNLSSSEDVISTKECFEVVGVEFDETEEVLIVRGKGAGNFATPFKPLYAGNSGTTTRLISGFLIAQNFKSIVTGDFSLSQRPMKRVVDPLRTMGGDITCSKNDTLPIMVNPIDAIKAINYDLPIPSAQIKSSVLIAGLHSDGVTSVIEKVQSRNHTEKMLGLKVERTERGIISYSSKKNYPQAREYFVPSDISTAAFFVVLTLLSENSSLTLKNVSLNETRTGYLEVLKKMGAHIKIDNKQEKAGEEFGDVFVESSKLNNVEIPEKIIPNIIDEIPILSIAGLFAEGRFEINKASELRKKETDRIKAVCENLRLIGLNVEESEDGYSISGSPKNIKAEFQSYGDHRIAMAFGILSMLLPNGGKVNDFDCVKISNPEFMKQIKNVVL
ncbi:MAG: 3-phosphoshikimate 1-carboxyvinyltransferase [Ignavibacteriaceae bacterium]